MLYCSFSFHSCYVSRSHKESQGRLSSLSYTDDEAFDSPTSVHQVNTITSTACSSSLSSLNRFSSSSTNVSALYTPRAYKGPRALRRHTVALEGGSWQRGKMKPAYSSPQLDQDVLRVLRESTDTNQSGELNFYATSKKFSSVGSLTDTSRVTSRPGEPQSELQVIRTFDTVQKPKAWRPVSAPGRRPLPGPLPAGPLPAGPLPGPLPAGPLPAGPSSGPSTELSQWASV